MSLIDSDATHLRKYLTTLGVSIVAGTLSLCGLFMRLAQGDLLSRSAISRASPLAQLSLRRRQLYINVGTAILPYFLLAGILIGCALAVYGLFGWHKRQQVADLRENLGLQKDEAELRQMTRAEVDAKLEADVLDERVAGSASATTSDLEDVGQRDSVDAEATSADEPADRDGAGKAANSVKANSGNHTLRETYAEVEDEVLDKLLALTSEAGIALETHVRADVPQVGTLFIDAITRDEATPAVFEVKYVRFRNGFRHSVEEGLSRAAIAASALNGVGIVIVVADDRIPRSFIEAQQVRAVIASRAFRDIGAVVVVGRSEWSRLTKWQLSNLLGRFRPGSS